jgi:hypothetical protein
MAWIESHQEMRQHPKTRRLARRLGVSLPAAIGHLHLLWWWALDYAQDGKLARFCETDIAEACEWPGAPSDLVAALVETHWLDADEQHIHDWEEYSGALLRRRAQNAERKRRERARHADVTDPSRAGHGATEQNTTVQNRTVPNRDLDPDQSTPLSRDLAPPRARRTGKNGREQSDGNDGGRPHPDPAAPRAETRTARELAFAREWGAELPVPPLPGPGLAPEV